MHNRKIGWNFCHVAICPVGFPRGEKVSRAASPVPQSSLSLSSFFSLASLCVHAHRATNLKSDNGVDTQGNDDDNGNDEGT